MCVCVCLSCWLFCECMRCVLLFSICFFFFFKQKTAYEMRISDWSSDVCSSDLMVFQFFNLLDDLTVADNIQLPAQLTGTARRKAAARAGELMEEIGRASCRERVCTYV